jgi:hypothetical protein
MQVFCWKTLRVGIYQGMLGRVHLVKWQGDTGATICHRDDFDVPTKVSGETPRISAKEFNGQVKLKAMEYLFPE